MAGGARGKGKTRGAAEIFCPAASVCQGEAALEKTRAEAGRALWHVLHADGGKDAVHEAAQAEPGLWQARLLQLFVAVSCSMSGCRIKCCILNVGFVLQTEKFQSRVSQTRSNLD